MVHGPLSAAIGKRVEPGDPHASVCTRRHRCRWHGLSANPGPDGPAPARCQAGRAHFASGMDEKVDDPFYWLREKSNPEVVKYLEAENAYTEAMTKEHPAVRRSLYKEMLGHIKQTDLTCPDSRAVVLLLLAHRGRASSTRFSAARRSPPTVDWQKTAPEEVLLDLNELAKGCKFLSLGAFEVSDDANLLAYTADTTGFRQYRLYVKDLRTGIRLAGQR